MTYRFLPSMIPGVYAVFDGNATTRLPGNVSVSSTKPRVYTYTREKPPTTRGAKLELVSFTAKSIDELREKIANYFSTGAP